jgi:hypothetical protein
VRHSFVHDSEAALGQRHVGGKGLFSFGLALQEPEAPVGFGHVGDVAQDPGPHELFACAVGAVAHAVALLPAMILRTVTWLSLTPRTAVSSRHSSGKTYRRGGWMPSERF